MFNLLRERPSVDPLRRAIGYQRAGETHRHPPQWENAPRSYWVSIALCAARSCRAGAPRGAARVVCIAGYADAMRADANAPRINCEYG